MARIIFTSRYLKNQSATIKNFVEYIATRPNAEIYSVNKESRPSTEKQQKWIDVEIESQPELKESFEYEDFIGNSTVENASLLISRIAEYKLEISGEVENYIGYLANRPRSVKLKQGHALWNGQNEIIDLNKVKKEVSGHKGYIWTHVISLRREDAQTLGYDNAYAWRELVRSKIPMIAENMKIPVENLKWYAAFHNEGQHPHLHICFWDKAQKIAKTYVPPKVANDIRIALIKSTFADKIAALYEQKKLAKQNIGGSYDEAVVDFDNYMKGMRAKNFKAVKSEFDTYSDSKAVNITQLFNSNEQLAEVAEKLFKLRNSIPKGGRVAYKLLPPEVKADIDALTDELIKSNTYLQAAVGQYIDSLCELKKLYTSLDDPDKLKDYRDKCEDEAKKQISAKIVKSLKAIISKEYDVRIEYTAARKKYFAMELMREILDFFACGIVANNSEWQEKHSKDYGDLSDRAMKEWYLKNKDKGMEF